MALAVVRLRVRGEALTNTGAADRAGPPPRLFEGEAAGVVLVRVDVIEGAYSVAAGSKNRSNCIGGIGGGQSMHASMHPRMFMPRAPHGVISHGGLKGLQGLS